MSNVRMNARSKELIEETMTRTLLSFLINLQLRERKAAAAAKKKKGPFTLRSPASRFFSMRAASFLRDGFARPGDVNLTRKQPPSERGRARETRSPRKCPSSANYSGIWGKTTRTHRVKKMAEPNETGTDRRRRCDDAVMMTVFASPHTRPAYKADETNADK